MRPALAGRAMHRLHETRQVACPVHFSVINHRPMLVWPILTSPSRSTQHDFSASDVLTMLKDGEYAAWFRTSRGEGTGIVRLENGKITGGDSFFNYRGDYAVDGERFTATLTTSRRADGPTTVLGVDEIELKLTGTFNALIANCSGRSEQAPDIHFEATLFLGQDVGPAEVPRPASDFKIAKLPKAHHERYPPRNPFGPGPSR